MSSQVLERNNVSVSGGGNRTLVFIHGYGCDQTMWRFVAPRFENDARVVLYDLTGMGQSDHGAYDFDRYTSLEAHAEDLCEILDEMELVGATLVGHSVGATIACLAARMRPDRVAAVALVAPSPSFLNDGPYVGGFDRESIEGLVALMEENFLGWTEQVAPVISGQPASGETTNELTRSFCRTDPSIAKHFGRVTFLADHRADMPKVLAPALILQVSDDALAPQSVGEWLEKSLPKGELQLIDTTGHCPHLTAPDLTFFELRAFLERQG